MKNLSSLLRNERTGEIPQQTFTDLQCAKLFSEPTVRILSRPADGETILLRQETFRLLNEERCNQLRELLPILSRLKFLEEKSEHPDTDTEAIFLQCSRLETLLEATHRLCALGTAGPLFLRIKEELEGKEQKLREEIGTAAAQARALLKGISRIDIQNGILPCGETKTCNDVLLECGRSYGCDLREIRSKKIPLGKVERDYFQVFEETLLRAKDLLSPYAGIATDTITAYEEEVKFFLEIYEFCQEAKKKRIPICYPSLSETPAFTAEGLYDVTLLHSGQSIVPNDAWFTGKEPFFFLTGANGGGKTTYLRAVGCNLILALAGCPIFATRASVYPFTSVFSHFPEDENFHRGGRLENELHRAEKILSAEGEPFLLFNEPYSSTDDLRGFEELRAMSDTVKKRGFFGICVTHLHRASSLGFPQLSTIVEEGDHNRRTFRIKRQQGQESSFAADILKKYGLDETTLRERRAHREDQPSV